MAKIKNLVKKGLIKLLPGKDPDFLIIGAQKSATTSLHYYLRQHKDIVAGKSKEIDFFSKDMNYFKKGNSWYRSHFKQFPGEGKKQFFEASPSYLYRSFAPDRIYKFNKEIKLIVLLRSPAERSFSAWNMYRDIFDKDRIPERFNYGYDGRENYLFQYLYKDRATFPSFEECIEIERDIIENNPEIEEPSILRRSIYYDQLERYLQYFDKNQLLILEFREFLHNKIDSLNKICRFLQVEESDWLYLTDEPKHEMKYKTSINLDTKLMLERYFEEHNNKLFQLIDKSFDW